MVDFLPPGLYEMIINGDVKTGNLDFRFEERSINDILAMADSSDGRLMAAEQEVLDKIQQAFAAA
jgi:hypothetical protein